MKLNHRDYGDMLLGLFVWIASGMLLVWLTGWIGFIVVVHVWSAHVLLRGKDSFEVRMRVARKCEDEDAELVLDFDFNDRVEKP